jgi:uncharacterized protein YjbI with pentapeptide repeats
VSAVESEILLLADVVANEVMPRRAPASKGELSGLDLARADLRRCNLRRANLSGSNLLLANLSGADLRNANLSGCILTSANLSGADLRDASLAGGPASHLRNARLDGAMLRLANLDGANAQAVTCELISLFATSPKPTFARRPSARTVASPPECASTRTTQQNLASPAPMKASYG